MKKIIMLLLLAVLGFTAQAQEVKKKNATLDLEVKGNCDMCKKRIEKAAFSVPGVKSAVWHSDDQMLHLILNEQKCSGDDIAKAVAKAGHDTKIMQASAEDYGALHECCQYDRK
jgi:mercuric ion binding protein